MSMKPISYLFVCGSLSDEEKFMDIVSKSFIIVVLFCVIFLSISMNFLYSVADACCMI